MRPILTCALPDGHCYATTKASCSRDCTLSTAPTLMRLLCQPQSALQATSLQPLLALKLPQLLLGSAFGIPPVPLMVVVALILKAFLVSLLQGQHPLELANPACMSRWHWSLPAAKRREHCWCALRVWVCLLCWRWWLPDRDSRFVSLTPVVSSPP